MKSKIEKKVQRKLEGCKSRVEEGNTPQALKDVNQWVAWRYGSENGKRKKIPINPRTGGMASVSNPET